MGAKNVSDGPALPAGLASFAEFNVYGSPEAGVDKPEAVVRMIVLDAIKMFVRTTGRHPRLIYIPKALEAALQVDRGRNLGQPSVTHGKIREAELVFTCRPVWDSAEFRLE